MEYIPTSGLSVSASDAVKHPDKTIKPKVEDMPLFSHWFAIEVYDLYIQGLTSNTEIKLTIHGQEMTLTNSILTKFVNEFKSTLMFSSDPTVGNSCFPEMLRDNERTLTALLAPIYNARFCHQLPIRMREEDRRMADMPDSCIVKLIRGTVISIPLVGDQKKYEMTKAINQTIAYALAVEGEHLMLGLAATYTKVTLLLFIPFSGKLSMITICSAFTNDDDALKHFFCALYGAVHSLLCRPISAKPLAHPMTFKCCSTELSCLHQNKTHSSLKDNYGKDKRTVLIHCKDKCVVKKYYDDLYHTLPSEKAIQFIPDSKLHYSSESRLQILEYPYFIETVTTELMTTQQIIAAIRTLDRFHSENMVHGDIRRSNVIVSGDNVHFIDVDFVNSEGSPYPSTYNHQGISERHPEAQKDTEMKKIHDRYALHEVIAQKVCTEKLLDESVPLETIINLLTLSTRAEGL